MGQFLEPTYFLQRAGTGSNHLKGIFYFPAAVQGHV